MNTALRFIICVGLVSIICACSRLPHEAALPAANTSSSAEDLAQAKQLYAQRDNLMLLREGIVALRQATTKDPGNYEATWQLAKFNYYLATHTQDGKERDQAFQNGIEAGQTAVELQNDKPDGHFWLGANYGGAAEKSSIQGLATVEDIQTEMNAVLRLDEGYQNGSAYMVLGLVYLNAPYLLGGDPKKAIDVMEKGLRFGEPNAFLHLHLAEAYAKAGRSDEARKQISFILSMKPDQNYLPEYKEASTDAQKLLDQINQAD